MSVLALLSARAGLEATRGTGVTPTRLIYFDSGFHQQKIASIAPSEKRASYRPTYRAYPGIERNSFAFGGPVTFDDLIWWANLGIKAVASGTGAGADKTWAFVPTSTADDLKSASLQWGYTDNISATQPAYQANGCLLDELELVFAKDADVQFTGTILAPGAATQLTAFTGALSDRATVSALGTATQVFVDPTTIGTTADPQIMDATFSLANHIAYLDTLNNSAVAAQLIRPDPVTWKLVLTRYYANDTERDAYVAKTERKIRIRTLGPTLGGSAYKIDLDVYGFIDDIENADVGGIGVEKITVLPLYDTGATADFSLTVVNATSSIT